jgi:hypothetical protein
MSTVERVYATVKPSPSLEEEAMGDSREQQQDAPA